MQQSLISVIVPAYNVEKYLDRFFHSLLHQTYKNLEIIVINDASIDKTGEICDQYVKQYSNIKVIHHEKNVGVSVSRNNGLDRATGDYIGFLDPDDDFTTDIFKKFYNFSIQNDCDLVVCGWHKILNKKKKKEISLSEKDMVLGKNQAMQMLFDDIITSHLWNKFYKRELWDGIRFSPGKFMMEDLAVLHLVFDKAQRVGYIAEPLYYYYINNGSLTTTYRQFKFMCMYLAFKDRLEFAEKKYPEMTECLQVTTLNFARLTLDNYLINNDECDEPYMDEIIERMIKGKNLIHKSPYMKWYNKLMILFYNFSPKWYKKTIKYIHIIFYFLIPRTHRLKKEALNENTTS